HGIEHIDHSKYAGKRDPCHRIDAAFPHLLLSLQVHPEYGGKKCIDTDSPDEKSESYPHDILNIHIFDQITQIQISEEPVEKFREYLIRHNQKRHDHDQKKRCGRNSRCCSL